MYWSLVSFLKIKKKCVKFCLGKKITEVFNTYRNRLFSPSNFAWGEEAKKKKLKLKMGFILINSCVK